MNLKDLFISFSEKLLRVVNTNATCHVHHKMLSVPLLVTAQLKILQKSNVPLQTLYFVSL